MVFMNCMLKCALGHKPEVYAKESVLVALQRLEGSYDSHKITQYVSF